MARVRGDVFLSDLTIPGTHDSCTYVGTLAPESRCQSMGIREQLIAGIRYLDLRPKLEGAFLKDPDAKLTIYHGTSSQNWMVNTHIDLQDVIDDCAAFLAASPGETIVVSIKNDDPHANNVQWFIDILWKYFNRNASLWYLDEALPMLGEVRGKLVLFRQFDLPAGVSQVNCGLPVDIGWGGADGKHRDDFTIDCGTWSLRGQDNYSDPIPKWDHIKALLDAAVATPTVSMSTPPTDMKRTLFVNYTSAVSPAGIPSATSDDINPKLCTYLRTGAQGRRLGIIPMDFPGEAIGRLIDRNLLLAPSSIPPRISLQVFNSQFVGAEGGGGGSVVANRAQAAAWETFEVCVVDGPSGKIGLRCFNGRFLSAEGGGGRELVADRVNLAAWETFTVRIVDQAKGLITLQAYNGQYVQAAGGGGGKVDATANAASGAAILRLVTPAVPRTSMPSKIALQASNGRYVCAENGGGSTLVANRGEAATWETFTVVPVDPSRGQYGLQASNKSFVCAEKGGGSVLVANRNVHSSWETFTIYQLDGDRIAIRAHNGQYVQAASGGAVDATANAVSQSAMFKLVVPANLMTSMPTKVALQASNGLYVCAENGGGSTLVVNRGQAAAWETFTVVPVDVAKGQYGLQASNKQFVCAENGGGSVLVANRNVRSSWETFTIDQLGGDRIAIRAYNGQYVRADNGGGAGLSASSGFVLTWETFTLVPVS
jgi:uncharacterized protein YdbL (DUF1318 family)